MAQGRLDRREARARLAATPFDVIVVGANLVGSGIAHDASARGLRTALLEPEDFGAGDCSGASDLWPLLQAPVNALSPRHLLEVVEAAAERQYLRQIAPHLVGELPIVVPVLEDGGGGTGGGEVRAHRRWVPWAARRAHRLGLTPVAALSELTPLVRQSGLAGAWASTRVEVDEAVLSLALARTAALDGAAVVLNRVAVSIGAGADGAQRVRVIADGESFELAARVVVEARRPPEGEADAGHGSPRRFLRATLPRERLPVDAALVLPDDGGEGMVCCVPQGAHVRLGTMVRDRGPLAPHVGTMLATLRRRLQCEVDTGDLTAAWEEACPPLEEGGGGIVGRPTRRQPVHQLAVGRVSVLGGRVTTYREIARQTVDAVVDGLDERTRLRLHRRSLTHRIQLRGAAGWAEVRDGRDLGAAGVLVGDEVRHRLAHRYGGEARVLLAMLEHQPRWREPLVEGLPYLAAEAVYAVREEMACGLVDVLARRTPALLEDADATAAAAGRVAELLAPEAGWDVRRRAAEIDAVQAEASRRLAHRSPVQVR